MGALLGFLALIAAFVGAEWVGWWAVPAAAALFGLLGPRFRRPALRAGLAAGTAALFWLAGTALGRGEAFERLSRAAAGIFHLPAPVILLLTILFPALLAWSAAAFTGAARPGAVSSR